MNEKGAETINLKTGDFDTIKPQGKNVRLAKASMLRGGSYCGKKGICVSTGVGCGTTCQSGLMLKKVKPKGFKGSPHSHTKKVRTGLLGVVGDLDKREASTRNKSRTGELKGSRLKTIGSEKEK